MAVYKATYCQPFLSSVDPTALVPTALAPSPYVPLTCNVDTSNQNVTGYSIQIWDSENNLIFPSATADPAHAISPISELSMTPDYSAGVNGASLTIPFFQLVKYGTASTSVPPFLHSFNAIYCDATSGTFTDVSGNPIDFSVGGSMYKWAITLYQGVIAANPLTASVTPIGSTISISVLYMSYDSLTENYFDMKLASGTVMGSTNKRVQFGYIKNGKGHIADPSVVLQGRYMQLLNGSVPAAKMDGPSWRAYVESYDSTYGHAYPISSWSSKYAQNIVDDANYVSFYKYANDPEYVKASEQVVTATDVGQSLSCLQSGGLPMVGGHQVNNGDWVLVKDQGQSDAYENGIYIAHPLGTAWERVAAYDSWAELLGVVVYVSAGNSAGTNWMSQAQAGGTLLAKSSDLYDNTIGYVFLGAQIATDVKTVRTVGSVTFKNGDLALLQSGYDNSAKTCLEVKFIVNSDNPDGYWGSNGSVKAMDGADYAAICLTGGEISADRSSIDASLNYQPLKMVQDPGGSTVMALVAYDGAASAYSRLYFQPEEPIVLFPDLVTKTVTYLISSNGVSNGISGVTDFDGYGLSDIRTGQTCIDTKVMKLYTASVAGTAVTWTASADTVDSAGIYYVSAGNYYGGKSWTSLVASGTLATRSFAATMAQVFHNSPTTTFVSPFIGMSKRMRIEFQNGQTVTYTSTPAGSSALTTTYLNINDIDTTVWCITHEELASSSCVTSTIGGARGLPSGATTAFPSAPYKYNLLSYFQQSDDNAFYAYKIPTLTITDTNNSNDTVSANPWTVNSRKLSLLGSYSQLQRGAWESFQWDLYKADGTLIQTTGKKYQGTMTAVFYGLASGSSYYVILTVVDSLGNVLTQRQDFQISSTASTVVPIPFTMTPECDAQCVKLDYQDTGLVWPAMVFSSKAYAYTLWNSAYLNGLYQSPYSDYDFSLSYPGYAKTDPTNDLTYMAITECGCGDRSVLGDGMSISSFGIIPIHVWNYPSVMSADPDYLSYPIRTGLIYQTYFAPSATSAPIGAGSAADSSLALWDDPETDVGHDQISAQTCVEIDSNACGEIFTLTMGSLTLSVSLPDELSGSGTAYSLNASRNQIVAKLGSSSASLCAPNSSAAYTWFAESASAADQYYYLQFASSDAEAEHFHWPYIGSSGESFYYDKVYNPTASAATARWSATAPAYPMGNLLFIAAAEDIGHSCAYYWPDRGFTVNYHLLSDVNAYFGVAPVGGGINLAQETSDKLFLFGDGATVDPTAYYLDVYDASAGNYVDSPLYGYARRSDSIVGWSGKKVVFTIRGMGLSALSQASSLSFEPITDSDQTAGIRFTSGTSYLEIDMAII